MGGGSGGTQGYGELGRVFEAGVEEVTLRYGASYYVNNPGGWFSREELFFGIVVKEVVVRLSHYDVPRNPFFHKTSFEKRPFEDDRSLFLDPRVHATSRFMMKRLLPTKSSHRLLHYLESVVLFFLFVFLCFARGKRLRRTFHVSGMRRRQFRDWTRRITIRIRVRVRIRMRIRLRLRIRVKVKVRVRVRIRVRG